MPSIVFIGLGYSVRPLAEHLVKAGWGVTGTTRSEEKAEELTKARITALLWEAGGSLDPAAILGQDALVVSVAPDEKGCPVARAIEGAAQKSGTRILYLSSSGVYGDFGGKWVGEETSCRPGTARGKQRILAEDQWRTIAARTGAHLTLCRLAGIYGPGRSAVDSLSGNTPGARAGLSRRLIKEGQVFNRIHRDDIGRGLLALLKAGTPPTIVNFADDEPSPSADPITFAAQLLGIDPPPLERYEDVEAELSPMARSFYAENKRLKNDRLKELVGTLAHPTYREGLAAIAKAVPPRW